jgi:hypothetical protein
VNGSSDQVVAADSNSKMERQNVCLCIVIFLLSICGVIDSFTELRRCTRSASTSSPESKSTCHGVALTTCRNLEEVSVGTQSTLMEVLLRLFPRGGN